MPVGGTPDGHASDPDADRDTVARLLGRVPAGAFTVAVRRTDGTPAVIENAPLLDDGRPMPTLYWLVDPALREAVSRLEASGGVRRAADAVPEAAVADAHARYAARRDRALPVDHRGPAPSGGVGGTRQGVKCLHAHLAWHLTGGDDPVGRWTAGQLGVRGADFVVESSGVDDRRWAAAAVDCGSNSTRLLVVAPDGTVLERQMRITRLGEGVDATRKLSPAAIDRTLAVLRDYRRAMDGHAVARVRVVATSAARDAVNAEEFEAAAADVVGVRPEILSGEEEGRLSFAGATAHLPPDAAGAGPVLVVDIGGGSTELVVGHLGPVDDGSAPDRDDQVPGHWVRPRERAVLPRRPAGRRRNGPGASRGEGRRRGGSRRVPPAGARRVCSSDWRAPCPRSPVWSAASRRTTGPASTMPC